MLQKFTKRIFFNVQQITNSEYKGCDSKLRLYSSTHYDLYKNVFFNLQTDLNPPSVVTALISIAVSKVGRIKTYNFFRDRYEKFYTEYAVSETRVAYCYRTCFYQIVRVIMSF